MADQRMEEELEEQHDAVELGFAEKCDKKIDLSSLFHPSKLGGRPAWLSFDSLPRPDKLQCGHCKEQMVLLCQLYVPTVAPLNGVEQQYHRTLYLFCCRQGPCSKLPTFVKAFRAEKIHLPSQPNYEESDKEDAELIELCNQLEKPHKLCNLCGCLGDKMCSSCHEVWYCCKQHQAVDWKHRHKKQCNANNLIEKLANIHFDDNANTKHPLFFDEYEIVIEEEPAATPVRKMVVEEEYPEAAEPVTDKKLKKELLKLENKEVDEVFAEFRERIDREPEQIIRYAQGATPLWVSKDNVPAIPGDIPPCSCGAQRQFEFQVLPQMINYLGVETTVDSIDFGTLCVYTCSVNCREGDVYKEEVVWKQDFS
jgi:pre-rRNA-processing protein TSR4